MISHKQVVQNEKKNKYLNFFFFTDIVTGLDFQVPLEWVHLVHYYGDTYSINLIVYHINHVFFFFDNQFVQLKNKYINIKNIFKNKY